MFTNLANYGAPPCIAMIDKQRAKTSGAEDERTCMMMWHQMFDVRLYFGRVDCRKNILDTLVGYRRHV